MDEPILKKENTIGINYVVGEIKDSHFEYIIENLLGVPESEIDGIDDRGNVRFIFKVLKPETYEHICEHFAGRDIPIGNGNIIQVDDISSYGTMVEISRVPFEISNDTLTHMLERFGDVYKCQSYFRQFGKYSKFNKSGKRRVWMKIKEQIPQSLTINQTQTTINVEYLNQPMTCNQCGNAGHRARRCTTERTNYKHLVNINVSNNVIDKDTESVQNDDESFIDMDIHIEPSQQSKPLECHLCEYKCKYDHILSEHVETHTGEKSFPCL